MKTTSVKRSRDIDIKCRSRLEFGPETIARTKYTSYLNSASKRSRDVLKSLQPFDAMDIPKIEECVEVIDIPPLQNERKKIGEMLSPESQSIRNQWRLYMSKAQIFGNTSQPWHELETFLLKTIQKLISHSSRCRKKLQEFQKIKEELEHQNSFANNTFIYQNQTLLNPALEEHQSYHLSLFRNIGNHSLLKADQVGDQSRCNQDRTYIQNSPSYAMSSKFNNSKLQPLQSNVCFNKSKQLDAMNKSGFPKYLDGSKNKKKTKLNGSGMSNDPVGGIDNMILLEITKLQKENILCKQKISELEKQNGQKMQNLQKKAQEEITLKQNLNMEEKHKFQMDLENKNFHHSILTKQFRALTNRFQILQKQHQELKVLYEKEQKMNLQISELSRYKEMWLMQHEQLYTLTQSLHKLKTDRDAEIKKTSGLKQKLKDLSKNYNYSYNASADNETNKQDLSQILKDFRDWLQFITVPRMAKGMMNNNTFFPEMIIQNAKETYGLILPKDDPVNYKILKPNFFIYFEAYEGIIIAEKKFPQRKIMPAEFFLTIRAILDSMFLHLTFTTDYKLWLSFPEFVISYIQKFQISPLSWKPRVRKSQAQSEQKINFLLNAFNLQAASSWQCEIFRSFLMEEYTIDEIYFYLNCRDSLLKGSQINNNLGSSDPIFYIKAENAEIVIKEKLKHYDSDMVEKIKGFILAKKKIKNNKNLIDVNFVLKLLLEVYSIEKIKSQKFFHHSFKSKSVNSKISYTEYSSFMEKNFEFLTKGDIAKLYREIYAIGMGDISYKLIHYVCTTRGLFIPLIQHKMMSTTSPLPVVLSISQPEQQSCSSFRNNSSSSLGNEEFRPKKAPKLFDDIIYLDLMNNVNKMVLDVQQFGLEELLNINIGLNKFLHENDKLKYFRGIFENKLLQETQKIIKLQAIYKWKSSESLINENSLICNYEEISKDQQRQKIGHLLAITHHSDDYVSSIKKWREERQASILKLTKNFKIRIQQSLNQFKAPNQQACRNKISESDGVLKGIGEADQVDQSDSQNSSSSSFSSEDKEID